MILAWSRALTLGDQDTINPTCSRAHPHGYRLCHLAWSKADPWGHVAAAGGGHVPCVPRPPRGQIRARLGGITAVYFWVYSGVVKAGCGGCWSEGGRCVLGIGGLCSRRRSLQCGGAPGSRDGLASTACPGEKEGVTGSLNGNMLEPWQPKLSLFSSAGLTGPKVWEHQRSQNHLLCQHLLQTPCNFYHFLQLLQFLPWLSQHPLVPLCASIPLEWGWGCGELWYGDSDRYKMGPSLLVWAGQEGTSKQSL